MEVKIVPVEAHHSIGKVERYHAVLRRAYRCIREQTPSTISKEFVLQTAVKAVNDSTGPDGLTPTLLVFGDYPKITQLDPPAASISQRAATIARAIEEVRKAYAKRDVREALATRNGPSTDAVHRLPIGSYALVWREGKNRFWEGPYRVIA
jgi:hypothetical protein